MFENEGFIFKEKFTNTEIYQVLAGMLHKTKYGYPYLVGTCTYSSITTVPWPTYSKTFSTGYLALNIGVESLQIRCMQD